MKINLNDKPIQTYPVIPSKWNARPNVINYDKLAQEEHYKDGWRDYIDPDYNPDSQKIGGLIYDQSKDIGTRSVIQLTQEELIKLEEQKTDSDISAQSVHQAELDGQDLFRKFFIHIRRLMDKSTITPAQARNSVTLLFDALLPITFGQFEFSQIRLNALPVPQNAKEKAILDEAKQRIQKHLSK